MGQGAAGKIEGIGAASRSWVMLVAAFGIAHLCISLGAAGMFFIAGPLSLGFTTGYVLRRAGSILWPYVILLALFILAFALARKRRAYSAAVLALALAASAFTCIYDLRNERLRVTTQRASGPEHYNPVWWWWRR
jgi:hypothetical protein